MLSNLRLRNFKGFKAASVSLRRVTLLAGLNSSGKSSLIQALLLLQQIERDPRDPQRVLLNLQGEHVHLGTGRDVLCEFAEEDELEITVESDSGRRYSLEFAYEPTSDRLHAPASVLDGLTWDSEFGNLHYLCAERWGPRVTYPLSKSKAEVGVGASGELAYHYLLLHRDAGIADPAMRHPGAKGQGLLNQVQAWLGEISPGTRLDIHEVPEADIAIPKFGFERSSDVASSFYRPTNVGFGLSYTLPIITTLLSAAAGSVVLLENPEAHCHPRGQSKLARLIAMAAKRLQVIVETHSDHLMNGLRVAVMDDVVSFKDVKFIYVRRDNGLSIIESPEVDENGRLSYWPEGFFDEHEESLARLVAKKRKN